jgi:hypothetical protein
MSDMPENKRTLPRLKGLSQFPATSRPADPPAQNTPVQKNGEASSPRPVNSNGAATAIPPQQPAPAQKAPEEPRVVVMPAPAAAEKEENCWKSFLNDWPGGLQRQGVLITGWDEQVPFSSFLTRQDLVMFERRNPDTNGARRILIGYDEVKAVKIVEVVKDKPFRDAGFRGPEPKTHD